MVSAVFCYLQSGKSKPRERGQRPDSQLINVPGTQLLFCSHAHQVRTLSLEPIIDFRTARPAHRPFI